LVNLKTKSAGDGYPKKAIEKTVLRFLDSRTFSHGLAPQLPFGIPAATSSIGWKPDVSRAPKHAYVWLFSQVLLLVFVDLRSL
jgi:hypothetical protein